MARSRRSNTPRIENLRWAGANHFFFALAAGASAQTMVTAAESRDTIMRIRGQLVAWLDSTPTPPKAVEVAIGALVMPEGQGTTVVSGPLDDESAPWLFYERFTLGYEEMVTDVIQVEGLAIYRATIDVKAMRILRPDRELQLVVEQATLENANSINLSFGFRILLGQH